jgi:hypothetical protein
MADAFLPFAVPDTHEDGIEPVVEAPRSGWIATDPDVQRAIAAVSDLAA